MMKDGVVRILSKDARERYVATGGSRCPMCNSQSLDGNSPIQVDGSTAWQSVGCMSCGTKWDDIYTLTGISIKDFDK